MKHYEPFSKEESDYFEWIYTHCQTMDYGYHEHCEFMDGLEIPVNHTRYLEFLKKRVCQKKKKFYKYMLTFTLDPKRHALTELYYDRVERYITSFLTNSKLPLIYVAIVREGSDKDHKHTHWHCAIVNAPYIDWSNKISYYKKLFGNVDVSPSKMGKVNYALKYMSKQNPFKVLKRGSFDEEPLEPNDPQNRIKLLEFNQL